MSNSFHRIERRTRRYATTRHRSTLGYWVPLAVTLTVAAVGFAAWVWSERKEDDDDDDEYYDEYDEGGIRPPDQGRAEPSSDDSLLEPGDAVAYTDLKGKGPAPSIPPRPRRPSAEIEEEEEEQKSVFSRVSSALRNTSSSQNILESARARVVSGISTAVAGALSSIHEETGSDNDEDQRRRSLAAADDETTETQTFESSRTNIQHSESSSQTTALPLSTVYTPTTPKPSAGLGFTSRRKTVAIVVSAKLPSFDGDVVSPIAGPKVQASILSQLSTISVEAVNLFILIYAPWLKSHPDATTAAASSVASTKPEGSTASSFSNIQVEEARTPGTETTEPSLVPGRTETATTVSAMTPTSAASVHPLQEKSSDEEVTSSLSSSKTSQYDSAMAESESYLAFVKSQAQHLTSAHLVLSFSTPGGYVHMLKQLAPSIVYVPESLSGSHGEHVLDLTHWVPQICLLVGGDLVDSDSDNESEEKEKWWKHDDRIGLGKGIGLVESDMISEDWARRVEGRD